MCPDVLQEQNPTLCCRLSLRPVDRQSESNLGWKLQAAKLRRETLPTTAHGNPWQNQNLVLVVRSISQFLENKRELPNFLDQEPWVEVSAGPRSIFEATNLWSGLFFSCFNHHDIFISLQQCAFLVGNPYADGFVQLFRSHVIFVTQSDNDVGVQQFACANLSGNLLADKACW